MAKIILVEDDLMIAEIYQKKFVDAGFEVFMADSGEQTLKIAKEEKIDAIISDLMMPKMDGFELLKKIRGGEYDPDIKIIISSNLSQREDRDKALELGADGFIIKSAFTPTELVGEVNRLLNQYQEQAKNLARLEKGEGAIPAEGAKKILLIEDEEIFVEMFGDKLRQDGFIMTFARNGAWGVKEALKENFDLIIVDMVMPAMSGEEVVGKLKMEEQTKKVPIVVLSASVDDAVARRVVAMGAEAFFIKTQITPSELSKKVQKILNTRGE